MRICFEEKHSVFLYIMPFTLLYSPRGLPKIRAGVINHIFAFLWDMITRPYVNCNGGLTKFGHEWIIAPYSLRGCNYLSMPKSDAS